MTSPGRSRPDPARIAAADARIPWQALEQLVHLDPAGRGLASFRIAQAPLDAGQVRGAALHLAEHGRSVGIVTGFCVATEHGFTAETDGPPGALFLARALLAGGIDVCLITDCYALPLLEFGCDYFQLDRKLLVEVPLEDGPPAAPARQRNDLDHPQTDRWVADFWSSPRGQSLTHLVAIERAGPSHLQAAIPEEWRDLCHNMRGESINAHTAKIHLLFESCRQRPSPITTIGVGDGGNEIGMGRFDWDVLTRAVASSCAGQIACRIATDFTIIAGVSNWGAYALALAAARLLDAVELVRNLDARGERELIEQMVRHTPAVDGLTLRREPTVDGLPLDVYLAPLVEMRKLLGYAAERDD